MPTPTLGASDLRLLDRFWREPLIRAVLPNGATVILKPDRSAALASVQVWVRTGSIHEGAQLGAGLSHYLEHMLFKGTERRAGREISATVQSHGGYINAYTTFDRTVYYIELPSEHTEVAIDLLADVVLHSSLPADEAVKERGVILREIAMTQDDPDERLWRSLFSTAFREHPYRHPVIGHRDLFSTATAADLTTYYRARYVPDNLVVIIVGDVDLAAAQAAVERHFGAAPRARLAPVLVPAEPVQLAPRAEHRFEDIEVARSAVAWQVPGLAHRDAPVLDLLAMALGHGESSILWQELREKAALVHTIEASCWNPGTSGLFCVTFTCDADKREKAAAALEAIVRRLASRGLGASHLKKALRQLVAGEIASRQTMSGQAARLGEAEVVVGDLDHSRSFFERLGSVTAADLRRVIRTYLVPTVRTSVSINPTASRGGATPGLSTATPAQADSFSDTRLPNGSRLLVQRNPRLPSLHFRLLMAGGPAHEPPGKRGATALLANLLTKDTRRRSAAEVARFIEEVGGAFYPFFGNCSLGLAAEVLPSDAGRAITLISEAVLEPAFKAGAVRLERDAQLASLSQDQDDVVIEARKLIRRKFFGAHPLALDALGEAAGVRALTPADLAALHRKLAVAPNIVLAVAGDLPRGIEASLRSFLARLPAGEPAAFGRRAASRLPADPTVAAAAGSSRMATMLSA